MVELSTDDLIQFIEREIDTVIGHPSLRVVIGADTLGTISTTNQQSARLCLLTLLLLQLGAHNPCLQYAHRTGTVLVLGTLILTLHHDARRQMGKSNRRIGLVDVLATGTRGAEGINFQIGRIDLHRLNLIYLRQNSHRACRGVNTPLGFGLRHALHAMGSRLKLEARIGSLPDDLGHHLFVAAMLSQAFADHLYLPPSQLSITAVHPKQITGKQGGLIATGPCADLEENILVVVGIPGQQQLLQIQFQLFFLPAGLLYLLLGHGAHLCIILGQHLLRSIDIIHRCQVLLETAHHRINLGILLG